MACAVQSIYLEHVVLTSRTLEELLSGSVRMAIETFITCRFLLNGFGTCDLNREKAEIIHETFSRHN